MKIHGVKKVPPDSETRRFGDMFVDEIRGAKGIVRSEFEADFSGGLEPGFGAGVLPLEPRFLGLLRIHPGDQGGDDFVAVCELENFGFIQFGRASLRPRGSLVLWWRRQGLPEVDRSDVDSEKWRRM